MMSPKSIVQNKKHQLSIFFLSLALGLLVLGLEVPSIVKASGPGDDPEPGDGGRAVIGLASDAVECLAVGNGLPGSASVVNLTWQGQVERAKLVLSVAGAEAPHTIRVNGRPVALAPVHPSGQPCSTGEYFYLDISPRVLVQGNNLVEITDDASLGDSWTAANVRLEVFGDFAIQPSEMTDSAVQIGVEMAPTAIDTFIFTFTSSYDGSVQEAMAQIPDGYDHGTPTPLLLAVHAMSGSKERGFDWFDEQADSKGWLLASPELHGSWPIPEECFEYPNDCTYDDKVLAGTTGPDAEPRPGAYALASLESQYDVIDTVNYMVQNYNVDPDRIYLAGYSMGGQASVIIAAKFPHLFAAVFDNKGPTDMAEWYYELEDYLGPGSSNRTLRKECHIDGDLKIPDENPFCYQRRSGIRFASNYIHIPISMTHSISDVLVPVHHSRDLRDAINSYGPDQSALLFEDTVVGPTCPPDHHCYEPDPMAVLNFLESFTLHNNPTHINITTDESKSYYWMNLAQTGSDHWSQAEVAYYPISTTVTATISDTEPLTVGFNLGSVPIMNITEQPGMGLPETTYLIKGGGNNTLHDYTSGYLTTTLTATGQFTMTISAIEADLSANPTMVSGWQTATSTITAIFKDHLNNPVPNGTSIQFSASGGTFPNGESIFTATVSGGQGQATTTLTLSPAVSLAGITASLGSVSDSTSVNVFYPALEVLAIVDQAIIYSEQAVTYTYQITNTGDVTLTNVTLIDDSGTPGDSGDDFTVCANITLTAKTATSCSHNVILTQTTINVATVTGQDPVGNDVTSIDVVTVTVISPAIKVVGDSYLPIVYNGQVVTFTYRLTNTGDTTLTGVTLVDDNGTPEDSDDDLTVCTGITLTTGATASCSRSTTLTRTATNTVVVTGQDPLGNDVVDSDTVTATVISPAIKVTITPSLFTIYGGQAVTFTYHLTNTGDTTLTAVMLVDDNGTSGDDSDDLIVCADIVLATGAMASCSRGAVLSNTTTNTVIATGQDPLGHDVIDEDDVTVNVISPAIEIEIAPNQTLIYSGDIVTYVYQITNTGNTTLTAVMLVDNNGTPGDGSDDVTVCTDITMTAGATTSCSRSTTLTSTTTSTATVAGRDPLGYDVVGSDLTAVTVISPSIEVVIIPNQIIVYSGQIITITYQITNTGNAMLTGVIVVDDNGVVSENVFLVAGATQSYTQNIVLYQTTTLTVTVTGRDPLGHDVTSSDSITVYVSPSFDTKIYLPIVINHLAARDFLSNARIKGGDSITQSTCQIGILCAVHYGINRIK